MPGSNSEILTQAVERLSNAADLAAITHAVAEAARRIAGAEGATFVLSDGDKCYYVDEDSISPLWKGRKFPAESCVSGWCMSHRETVIIPDIYEDPRVPQDAYRPTFVKSLCMVPVRSEAPIGAIGSYWARGHIPSDDEVKLLQILANSSAVAIENLSLRNAVMQRAEERDALLNRQQQLEFQLNSLAHDMRNPLATMMGFTELLQSHAAENLDPKSLQYLKSIQRTGQRVNRQIERMLALYRLSNQTVQIQRVDLSSMVEEIAEGLKAQDPKRKVELEITPYLMANADVDLIRLAIENLISNSFKYSRRKESTWIRFSKVNDPSGMSRFVIEDKGDGFDPLKASDLFKPLVRLHSGTEFAGTGLGLASVARIIELHGGTVAAEGRPSEGATFSFTLPN